MTTFLGRLICLLTGRHVPLRLHCLNMKPVIVVSDATGPLIGIEVCEQCGGAYWANMAAMVPPKKDDAPVA